MRESPDPVPPADPDLQPVVVDLLHLASWFHAAGDREKRDVARSRAAV